jgi:hypothetical protein
MLKKIKIAIIILVPLIIVFTVLSDQGSAELNKVIRNAIVVAYMNGYLDALTLKIKDIKKLKANERLLKQKVEKEAADYIFTVEKMNQK